MKKIIALLLALVMVFALAACASKTEAPAEETKTETAATETATEEKTEQTTEEPAAETAAPADFKVGFIMLHDENSTYDLNFINGAKEACRGSGRGDTSSRRTFPKVRNATTPLLSWLTPAATSSSPTPSVMRTT